MATAHDHPDHHHHAHANPGRGHSHGHHHHAPAEVNPDADQFLHRACEELAHRFNIGHATLQIETNSENACRLAPAGVV